MNRFDALPTRSDDEVIFDKHVAHKHAGDTADAHIFDRIAPDDGIPDEMR